MGILKTVLFIIVCFFSSEIYATFNIPPDDPNTPKTLADAETGTVAAGNTLSTNNDAAVTMQGGSSLVNDGTVTRTDASGEATIQGSNAGTNNPVSIVNRGNLTRGGGGGYVIDFSNASAGTDLLITNSSNISGTRFRGSTGVTTIGNDVGATFNTPTSFSAPIIDIHNAGDFTANIAGAEKVTIIQENTGLFTGNIDLRGTTSTSNVTSSGVIAGDITANNVSPASTFDFYFGTVLTGSLTGTPGVNNTLYVDCEANIFGSLTNMERVILNSDTFLVANYTQSPTGILTHNISNTVDFGSMNIAGMPTFATNTTLRITTPVNHTIAIGDTFDIITSNANPLPNPQDFTLDMTGVTYGLSFNLLRPTPLLLRLVAIEQPRSNFAGAVTFPGLKPLAQDLDNVCTNPSGNMVPVCQALRNLNSTDVATAVQSIAFDINGASSLATLSNQSDLFQNLNSHLDTVRLAGMDAPMMGYVAGDMNRNEHPWGLKPLIFGNTARQKAVQTIEGFRADSKGFGLLLDKQLNDNFTIGTGATYSFTNVKSLIFQNRTNIRSLQGLVYAVYEYCHFFADGILGLAENKYQNTHNIIIGSSLNRTAYSKHNGLQTSAKARIGYNIPVCDSELAPILSLFQTTLKQNAFIENNAGTLNQSISKRKDTMLQAGAGFKWTYTGGRDAILPDIHAFFLRNLRNPNLQTTASLLGGGAAFTTTAPNLPRNSYNLGTGITAFIQEDIAISFAYDLELRSKYINNAASLKFAWSF